MGHCFGLYEVTNKIAIHMHKELAVSALTKREILHKININESCRPGGEQNGMLYILWEYVHSQC